MDDKDYRASDDGRDDGTSLDVSEVRPGETYAAISRLGSPQEQSRIILGGGKRGDDRNERKSSGRGSRRY